MQAMGDMNERVPATAAADGDGIDLTEDLTESESPLAIEETLYDDVFLLRITPAYV